MLQVTDKDMPTEASWRFAREVPTMGSEREQQRVNAELAAEALAEPLVTYARVVMSNIYARK